MTFKKVLGLIALACLTIIGLSACTLDKESTWTYDKNKMQFVGQDASALRKLRKLLLTMPCLILIMT